MVNKKNYLILALLFLLFIIPNVSSERLYTSPISLEDNCINSFDLPRVICGA